MFENLLRWIHDRWQGRRQLRQARRYMHTTGGRRWHETPTRARRRRAADARATLKRYEAEHGPLPVMRRRPPDAA